MPRGGDALGTLNRMDISALDCRLAGCQVATACDVTNPLCGETGASMVYGPQKGASPEICRRLDSALAHYAEVIKKDLSVEVRDLPGAGAAGGLGAGLVAFLGAELRPGIDIVMEAVGLAEHLRETSLVFTGEGRIDGQTLFGKTVSGIAARAKASGIPVIAIAGEVTNSSDVCANGIDAVLSIAPGPISLERSLADAAGLIAAAAEQAMRLVLITTER